jgi:localization factor PodJL
MNSAPSWSIKGIDPQAREAAKVAARRSGQTLGQWLNSTIFDIASDTPEAPPARHFAPRRRDDRDMVDDRLDMLAEQLDAVTRQQSDTTLHRNYAMGRPTARDDEPMQYLIERIARNENDTSRAFSSIGNRLDQLTEVLSQQQTSAPHQAAVVDDERYETMEKALNSVVDYIETSDSTVRDRMKELQIRHDELAEKLAGAPKGTDKATHKILGEIEQQLTALGHRVDRMGDTMPPELSNGIETLSDNVETRLSGFLQRMESTEKQTEQAISQLHNNVEQRLSALAQGLDTLASDSQGVVNEAAHVALQSTRDEFKDVEGQLRALAAQIESASAPNADTEEALAALRTEFSSLTGDVDLIKHHAASEHDLQSLRETLDGLSQSVEGHFAKASNDDAFNELEKRLGEVTQRLNSTIENPAPDPNIELIERKVHEIDARLAASQGEDRSEDLMQAVEQQISGLAKRLNAAEQRYGGIQAIEKSIAQLFETVEETRGLAGEAATQAASKVADQLRTQMPADGTPSGTFEALEQGLAAVRTSAQSADQHTQETLEAVHDTLEKVVTRLVALENGATASPTPASALEVELPTIATAAATQADTAPQPEQQDAAWRAAIDAKSAQEMEEILAAAPSDQLAALPPASPERPEFDAGPSLGEPEADNVTRRNDFIAAARRAAQAAAQEPQQEVGRSRFSVLKRKKKEAKDLAADGGDGDGEVSKKRRPLILAAIVLLLIGAVSAYSFMGGKTNTTAEQVSTTPTTQLVPSNVSEPALLEMPVLEDQNTRTGRADIEPLELALPPGPGTSDGQTDVEMAPLTPALNQPAAAPEMPVLEEITTGSVAPAQSAEEHGTVTVDPLFGDDTLGSFSITPPPNSQPDQVVERTPATEQQDTQTTTAVTDLDELPPAGVGSMDLRIAAASGDATAQFIVASRYTDGEGVAQDYRLAAMWYQRAAARGLAPAQYRLATFYEKGRGVPEDLAAARIWYERAAEKGNRKAMHNLAVIYADGSRGTPNFAKAALWFRNAAELGLRDSQYNLAILHERGLGVEENISSAYRWFALAARQGDMDAQARVGVIEGRLSAQELIDIKLEVETWRPQQMVQDANVVTPPSNGWASNAATNQNQAGITRDLILETQTLLNALGYNTGTPDGIIGARTRQAISSFETENGMSSSGAVTPALIERLRSRAS